MIKRSIMIATGSYLPERVVTNEELCAWVNTSDNWIRQRTGIRQRHFADDKELTSHLAIKAARHALEMAKIDAKVIDLIVVATTTPDDTFPATATKVQKELGAFNGAAFDIQAVCAGFIYAIAVADNFLKAGQGSTALVIGAETFSRLLDWKDRTTCVLFGDGAGAVLLRVIDANSKDSWGVLSTHLHTDGCKRDILYVDGGPSATKTVGHVRMNGKEVFRHAVSKLSSVIDESLEANGLSPNDIDWLIPHQANQRIIDSIINRMKIPTEKVLVSIARHANTSAASLPLALDEAVRDGRVCAGHLLLLSAIGGGLAWGAGVVRFGIPVHSWCYSK
ncbi:3-oxoacyl-[acyl-carrier-protein] synthase 3 [Candidatus Endolissoclinum faulkneri L5]|uniref:Beta-ketoacyl-[acyl-carrier-protein] synthase III n=1 Tax=Candidatus Endolissoclinum faulkneri L5 TaxID=1401328 RepID=V9TU89_9PROT|nr:beta-ketoacyl-ACP synthase III [Candidatus Endolissoclinum faulkneri]AHC73707.1 3-oxoacyl-[acyl-carrier-protein] synthase 3 [Candidatus Endolissoclinum faulkneri L5]